MVLSTHGKVVTSLEEVDRWSLEEGHFCVSPKQSRLPASGRVQAFCVPCLPRMELGDIPAFTVRLLS